MKPIFFIGFMGSGKSTVGKVLHEKLQCQFLDTDAVFEQEECMKISDFFVRFGEEHFRQKEHMYLKACTKENTIVSTGGGMILRQDNRIWMKNHGHVVYLATSFENILKRLENDTSRPLFQSDDIEATRARFFSRLPFYEETAEWTINTEGKTPEEIAKEIMRLLNL